MTARLMFLHSNERARHCWASVGRPRFLCGATFNNSITAQQIPLGVFIGSFSFYAPLARVVHQMQSVQPAEAAFLLCTETQVAAKWRNFNVLASASIPRYAQSSAKDANWLGWILSISLFSVGIRLEIEPIIDRIAPRPFRGT